MSDDHPPPRSRSSAQGDPAGDELELMIEDVQERIRRKGGDPEIENGR
jgi:hypothetical protein